MMINLKRIAVLSCTIFLMLVASCSKEKPIANNVNNSLIQPGNNTTETKKAIPDKAHRRLNDIKLSVQLTKNKVLADWGPPDAVRGSGVEYLVYELEDGNKLWLLFASHEHKPLLRAVIQSKGKDAKSKTIFDGMSETKVR